MKKKGLIINKKLKDISYVRSRYISLDNKRKRWDHFYTFECSEFYKGVYIAEINQEIYDKAMKPIRRKMDILENIMDRIKANQ